MLTQWCWIDHGLGSTSILHSPCQGYKARKCCCSDVQIASFLAYCFWISRKKPLKSVSKLYRHYVAVVSLRKSQKHKINRQTVRYLYLANTGLFSYACICCCIFNVELLKRCRNIKIQHGRRAQSGQSIFVFMYGRK